jgi:hypothetical protein
MKKMDAKKFYQQQIAKGVTNVFDIMQSFADYRITRECDGGMRELLERQQCIISQMDDHLRLLKQELRDAVEMDLEPETETMAENAMRVFTAILDDQRFDPPTPTKT